MKWLLTVFAMVEVGAGLTLLVAPSALTMLLIGTQLNTPTALIVGRVAGVALLALVIACWLARDDAHGPSRKDWWRGRYFTTWGSSPFSFTRARLLG
jgi:hypothetical protein